MESIALLMDCMEYMRTLPDKAFDLAIVDPPYGGVTKGGYMSNNITGGVANHKRYHLALWEQEKPSQDYFDELFRVSKNQVIWGGNYYQLPTSQGWIVWDKKKNGNYYADFEMAWTSFNRASKMFRFQWDGMLQEDMKNKEQKIHPTQKPVALYKWIIRNYAKEGDRILDTHLGSGSSRIAAYDLGFEFVGCEIDEIYFKEQEQRFADYVAQERINIADFL